MIFLFSFYRGGGGVCVNCLHNTQGRFCDECQNGFFREDGQSLDSFNVCSPCECNTNGTVGGSHLCNPVSCFCCCLLQELLVFCTVILCMLTHFLIELEQDDSRTVTANFYLMYLMICGDL